MEFVSEDGSKTQIKPGQTREIGRADGLNASDQTISRRQVSFFIPRVADRQEDIRARFEVLGRNPIYVRRDNEVKIFRRFQRGEMGHADRFCFSAKNPVWYTLRTIGIDDGEEGVRRNDSQNELAENLESVFELEGVEDLAREGVDFSDIDPVKEFGFVVIGHDFDSYPKKMIRDIRNWDWFLDEPRKDGQYDDDDDDNEGRSGNNSAKRKRNKGREKDDNDEEWTGEGTEDNDVLTHKSRKTRSMPPTYTTRSNDSGKPSRKDENNSKKRSTGKKSIDYMADDDDDDESLGGFIVNDEDEKFDEDESDEEELVDDEDEDEDKDEADEEELVDDEDEDE